MTKEEIEAALLARKTEFGALDRQRDRLKYDHDYHVIRIIETMPLRIRKPSEAEEIAEAARLLALEEPKETDPKSGEVRG